MARNEIAGGRVLSQLTHHELGIIIVVCGSEGETTTDRRG
jgi:hypothetical protein